MNNKQNKNITLRCIWNMNKITFQTIKITTAPLKYNESVYKQALWLAPAPPAYTPNLNI